MDKLSYLNNANGAFLDDLYQNYVEDPQSVETSWQRFFEGVEYTTQRQDADEDVRTSDKEVAVMKLINAYRDRGHVVAKTNPVRPRRYHKSDLHLEYFGLSEMDLDLELDVGSQIRIGRVTLREIVQHLKKTYCRSIGAEYRYIPDSRIRQWLHKEMESNANCPQFTVDQRKRLLTKLAQAVGFEKFLHVKYAGQKRFSLEGCESFIPGLDSVFQAGARLGVKEFVIGTAHRGRLNVLVNLFGKSYEQVFSEFEGGTLPEDIYGDGDVKYHQGHSEDIVTADGLPLHLSLAFNPSHLEAVSPVVLGSVRAKGEKMFDGDFTKIVPVLVHGDAAIAGQGIVYEIANLSMLEGYATGGTIHIVINNQVGFTANYRETRSSLYCTDIAKVTECPVFHVNADDTEGVAHCAEMAIKLRQEFGIDVYIDILGYRRHGHNEGDDPNFTQPLIYKAIDRHPSVLDIYTKELMKDGVISEAEAKKITKDFHAELQESLDDVRENKPNLEVDFLRRQWSGFRTAIAGDFDQSIDTGVPRKRLKKIMDTIVSVPEGFTIYPKMHRIIGGRQKLLDNDEIDWGLGELLAYGSLLTEDVPVRISGQDSKRGTFAHRHSVLIDANDESEYVRLNHIQKSQERFQIYNSHLSEYGVMGFEYGYAVAMPNALVVWEAQFGDFANGAQIIIDQFISSAESKWQRMCGLVLFLPHGYEGQGPEHSSARVGRYLELCAQLNMIVACPTTAANMFHLLRRQIHQEYRKPLVVFTPKSMLRHELTRSKVSELTKGRFQEIIDDDNVDPKTVKRVLMCTGKVYYELLQYQQENNANNVAIVRFEQLYPAPKAQDVAFLKRYKKATDFIWVQEEAANMGSWVSMRDRFQACPHLRLVSRPEAASPATGHAGRHKEMQRGLIEEAFADI
jgi:2-oxoglutarate dehydrogenase E1 component